MEEGPPRGPPDSSTAPLSHAQGKLETKALPLRTRLLTF